MNLYIRYNVIKKWIDILFNIFGLLCCIVLFVDFRFVEIMDFCIMLFIFFLVWYCYGVWFVLWGFVWGYVGIFSGYGINVVFGGLLVCFVKFLV